MLATNAFDAGIISGGGAVCCASVALQAGTVPNPKSFRNGGSTQDKMVCSISEDVPPGLKRVSAFVKIYNNLATGMPEIGIILSPTRASSGGDDVNPGCRIKQIVQGSPAHRCGTIRAGDVISRINSTDVSAMETEEVVTMLKKAAIDCKWTYGPLRLELLRDINKNIDPVEEAKTAENEALLMTLMATALRKNSRMQNAKKPNPIRLTLLQRSFCDQLDKELARHGHYDTVYRI